MDPPSLSNNSWIIVIRTLSLTAALLVPCNQHSVSRTFPTNTTREAYGLELGYTIPWSSMFCTKLSILYFCLEEYVGPNINGIGANL